MAKKNPSETGNPRLPVYLTVALTLKNAVKTGEFPAGKRLPSERHLAEQLGVSRNTVRLAIEELIAEGIIVSKTRSGSFVAAEAWGSLSPAKSPDWPEYFRTTQEGQFPKMGVYRHIPDISSRYPGAEMSFIKRFFENHSIERRDHTKLYSDTAKQVYGSFSLRQAIAGYLDQHDIKATPANILIVSSTTQAMYILASAFLRHGSHFYYERSGYINLRGIISATGANAVQLPLDDEGIVIEKLGAQALFQKKAILHLQSANHHPTGITTSLPRRRKILKAFSERSLPVIELDSMMDIYAEELPPPTLKALDKNNSVIFIGNLARATCEDISMSWIVADEYVINMLAAIKSRQDKHVSTMVQLVAELSLTSGFYNRYMEDFRTFLIKRRDAYNEIMQKYLSDVATWHPTRSSYYLWPEFVKEIHLRDLKERMMDMTFNPGYFYDPEDTSHISICTLAMPPREFERAIASLKIGINRLISSKKQV